MAKAREIADFVWEIAPNPAWAAENIFEFGDGSVDVGGGIGVAWWIDSRILAEMARNGYRLGITHERVIYDLPDTYDWGRIIPTYDLQANQRIRRLAGEHGIAVHRFHSNIDLVDWGMPRALIDQLGWGGLHVDWSSGIPVVDLSAITLGVLIGQIKHKLGLPFVRYDGDPNRTIRRAAIAWGGLCQWWSAAACAAPLGFDVLIGGDIIDGVVRLAREQNWAVIDAMHHATEMQAMKILAARVAERFPTLQVEFYENTSPWAVM
jgi:putative NIF3 family GTP cyclohydrolase 1 type 2